MKIYIILVLIFISLQVMGQNEQSKTDWANLEKYALENQNLKPLSKGENRIIFMGNSITESWMYFDSAFFRLNGYINRAIGGQTTPQMLVRFRPDVIALKPSVVVMLAGINDIAQNTGPIAIEDIFGNIVSMAQLAKINNSKVVLSSVLPAIDFPWRPGLEPADKIVRLNGMIRAYCIENNIVYVDYYSKMVDEQGGLLKIYSDDGVHPTIAGYKVMEPLVQDAIRQALNQRM